MHLIQLLTVTLALAGACGRAEPPPPGADSAAMTPPAAGSTDASSRSFSSVLSQFEMAIPDRWEQRYTASERTQPDEYPGASSVVDFVFLPLSGGTPPAVLSIIRYPRAAWGRVASAGGTAVGQLVTETASNAFVVALPRSNPYPAGSDDATTFEGMWLTLEQVRRALRGR